MIPCNISTLILGGKTEERTRAAKSTEGRAGEKERHRRKVTRNEVVSFFLKL